MIESTHDMITRVFTVMRGNTRMEYPFKTFDFILDPKIRLSNSNQQKVVDFLRNVFISGYPSRDGKKSVSELHQVAVKPLKLSKLHYMTQMARDSKYQGSREYQHDVLQIHVLKNDETCVATEVPVWNKEMHGHIDILCLDPEYDIIYIYDFKPNAKRETKAASQLFRYKNLLVNLCGIHPDSVQLGYFDENDFYSVTI